MSTPPVRPPTWSLEFVRRISETVYRDRLNHWTGGGPGAVERMLEKDGDDGAKLRERAEAYNELTRAYLRALDIPLDQP